MRLMALIVAGKALCFFFTAMLYASSQAQTNDPRYYDIGTPTLREIWVDANNGSDSNSGETRETALRTLGAAWNQIPRGVTLTDTGYRIQLAAGTYDNNAIPSYFEQRIGTSQFPVIIQSADGSGEAVITAFMNIYDCHYLYLLDLKIAPEPSDTALHLHKCDHVLVRRTTMDGKGGAPQVFKVNQCADIYLEDCDVFGSSGSAVDFVATQNGRITGNRVHDAGSWAVLVKGGSAYFQIEDNELFNAERGGIAAGQTTGFEFLESPWLHYEAYDVKFINNIVHDTGGAGMAVNGGYNILFAYNTLYRVGREGSLIEVLFGLRVCSEDTEKCAEYLNAGGWGTKGTSPEDLQPLPNRNVFIYNNLIYNPADTGTRSTHFAIYGPRIPSPDSNIPSPVNLDTNLQIRGNVIWNRSLNNELGVEYPDVGCQPSNPTCNEKQLRAENAINSIEPQLVDPANGDFRPAPGSNLFNAKTYAIPDFDWSDAPTTPQAPAGNLSNAVTRDHNNTPREQESTPGVFTIPTVTTVSAANYKPAVTMESVVSAFGINLAPRTAVADSSLLPTVLEGTSVIVKDGAGTSRQAPLFLVSPKQVNYLIPAGTVTGTAEVTVENLSGLFSMGRLQIVNVAPGLFTADSSGKGLAAASILRVRADGTETYEPVARFDSEQNKIVAVPIDLSNENEQVYLILYGTGFRNRSSLDAVSVQVDGVDLQLIYAGAQGTFVGLDQVNARLSQSLAGRGDVGVILTIEGLEANTVSINIR